MILFKSSFGHLISAPEEVIKLIFTSKIIQKAFMKTKLSVTMKIKF